MNLDDACLLRSNELTRILAGSLAIDPIFVMPLIEKLKLEALTDINSRRFIEAIKDKLQLLQDATIDEQAEIVVHIANELHLLLEYIEWIILPVNLYQDAPAAITELQKLAITHNTINGLQKWVKALEERFS
jgi:hypothetical protein